MYKLVIMNETTTASFSFVNYKVKEFSIKAPDIEPKLVNINFEPSGVYNTQEGIYKLTLKLIAEYAESDIKEFAEVSGEGIFKFDTNTPLNTFPDYFYANSIAIMYPYLRAFMTTVTAVANIKPLIMPTLNLFELAEPLKKNTQVI